MRRIALVTGGSRGIGRACVERLAHAGWSVVFLCRAREDLSREITQSLRAQGCDVDFRVCDVADSVRTREVMDEILRVWRHVDLLVNNAAIAGAGLFTDVTEEAWRRMFAVNVDGAYRCTQAVLPGMISRRQGVIVNISSMWGEVGASCEVAYSAAKAALIGMTRALAKELGPSGIRVNAVAPGVILTDMCANVSPEILMEMAQDAPVGRNGTPMDVARAMEYLANAEFVTGHILNVDGGYVI